MAEVVESIPAVVESIPCECLCCVVGEAPHQPTSRLILDQTKVTTVGVTKSKTRTFQSHWYKNHSWLNLCVNRNKFFCHSCMYAKSKGQLIFSTKAERAFITDGFCNWKKATLRFKEHGLSQCHREAVNKIASMKKPGVHVQINAQQKLDQSVHRDLFMTELYSIQFLSRQGLALRGHQENEGNLVQLLRSKSNEEPRLNSWIENGKYLSPEVVNEIIKLMGNTVLREILVDIREAKWFTVLADETRDINNQEQLVVCIRWVNKDYEVCEDPVGLVTVPKTDAETIYLALRDTLIRCGLPLEHCRGQGYDGAANMMGHLSGVAVRIQSQFPPALPVHCLAHSLNLVLQEAAKKILILSMRPPGSLGGHLRGRLLSKKNSWMQSCSARQVMMMHQYPTHGFGHCAQPGGQSERVPSMLFSRTT